MMCCLVNLRAMVCWELGCSVKKPSTMVGSLKICAAKEGEMREKAELAWF